MMKADHFAAAEGPLRLFHSKARFGPTQNTVDVDRRGRAGVLHFLPNAHDGNTSVIAPTLDADPHDGLVSVNVRSAIAK